jgi:hypothetical protein
MTVVLSPLQPGPGPATRGCLPGRVLVGRIEGRVPLVVGAMVTFVAAVAFDVLAGEHPTHTLGLAMVALIVAALRLRLGGRRDGLLSVVSGAVVAQPALHASAKLDGHVGVSAPDGLLHVVAADGPGTAMQVLVSAAVVVAVATSGRLAQLLLTALRCPVQLLVSGLSPAAPVRATIRPRARRQGSMRRWCGWSIEAARRGPPSLSLP